MTELRRRMDDDMVARGFADRTRESYRWAVTGLARFYRRPPDQITDDEVQAYLVHLLRERQRSWSTCNVVANGRRFFYHTTLKRDPTTCRIPAPRQRQTLPAILSPQEVAHVIAHARNPKHRAMLLTAYAAGPICLASSRARSSHRGTGTTPGPALITRVSVAARRPARPHVSTKRRTASRPARLTIPIANSMR